MTKTQYQSFEIIIEEIYFCYYFSFIVCKQ